MTKCSGPPSVCTCPFHARAPLCDCKGIVGDVGVCDGACVAVAPPIASDSWLSRGDDFAGFRRAYAYASAQTNAIPAMAALTPEQVWHLYAALKRGEDMWQRDIDRGHELAEEHGW